MSFAHGRHLLEWHAIPSLWDSAHKKYRVRRSSKINGNQYRFSFDRWVNLLLATGKQCNIYLSKTRDCVPTFFCCVKDGYRKKGEWVCGVYHTLQEFVLKLFQDNVVFVWDLRSGWPCSYCKNKHHWSFNVQNLNRIKELGKTRFLHVICGHFQASNMHELCRFHPPNNVIIHGEHKCFMKDRLWAMNTPSSRVLGSLLWDAAYPLMTFLTNVGMHGIHTQSQ